jgi:hypothetical protein
MEDEMEGTLSSVALTREALYNEVWSEPITKVAERFGLSDRGLGKLCARHEIPVPPRGWWAKKQHGHRVRQVPLPPLTDSHRARITITPTTQKTGLPSDTQEATLPPEIAFEQDPLNVIAVDPSCHLTHPLIRDAATELRSGRLDRDGILRTPKGCLDVRVSRDSVTRALRILQALVRALESRGYAVDIKDGKTRATVLGEAVSFFMKERLKRNIRELTPEEHQRRRQGFEVYPYELRPTAELTLNIGDSYSNQVCADRGTRRLEDKLNHFIEALVRKALANRAARAERERAEQERIETERHRKEKARRRREHEAIIDRFDSLASAFAKTEQRRALLRRLREIIGTVDSESPLGQWLQAVEDWVEMSDPLQPFRDRGQRMKLYHGAYPHQLAEIRRRGFEDPELAEKTPPGILLYDRPPAKDWLSDVLELEVAEEVVLPYEVTKPGYVPRTFYVPARVLNRCLSKSLAGTGEGLLGTI